eukprot:7391946-Prymnesium_polylepis.1
MGAVTPRNRCVDGCACDASVSYVADLVAPHSPSLAWRVAVELALSGNTSAQALDFAESIPTCTGTDDNAEERFWLAVDQQYRLSQPVEARGPAPNMSDCTVFQLYGAPGCNAFCGTVKSNMKCLHASWEFDQMTAACGGCPHLVNEIEKHENKSYRDGLVRDVQTNYNSTVNGKAMGSINVTIQAEIPGNVAGMWGNCDQSDPYEFTQVTLEAYRELIASPFFFLRKVASGVVDNATAYAIFG